MKRKQQTHFRQNFQIRGLPTILPIDRSIPFNTKKFFDDPDCRIAGNNQRASQITEIDRNKIRLVDFDPKRKELTGGAILRRIRRAGYTPLDAKVFEMFYNNQCLIPQSWTEQALAEQAKGKEFHIYFDGTKFTWLWVRATLLLAFENGDWRNSFMQLPFHRLEQTSVSAVIE